MKFTQLAAAITLGLAMSAAQAATAGNTFNVKLTVTGTCEATAFTSNATSDVDFGTQTAAVTSSALQATNGGATTLAVRCSKGKVVTIGLTPSNANTLGAGSMTNGTDAIAYQLRQPAASASPVVYTPAYTVNWGNTGAGLLSVTGKGLALANVINIPVQATVAANALDVSAGAYTDAVTATLTY